MYLYDIKVICRITYNLSTVKAFNLNILIPLTFIAVSGPLLFYYYNEPLLLKKITSDLMQVEVVNKMLTQSSISVKATQRQENVLLMKTLSIVKGYFS